MAEFENDNVAIGSIAYALSLAIANIANHLVSKRLLSPDEAISAFQSAADSTRAMEFGKAGPFVVEQMAQMLRTKHTLAGHA